MEFNTTDTVALHKHVVVDSSSYTSDTATVDHEYERRYFQDKQEKSDSESGQQQGEREHDLPAPETREEGEPADGNALYLILALLGQIRRSQAQTAATSGVANAAMATEAANFGYSSAHLNKDSEIETAKKESKGADASIIQGSMGIAFGAISIGISVKAVGRSNVVADAKNTANTTIAPTTGLADKGVSSAGTAKSAGGAVETQSSEMSATQARQLSAKQTAGSSPAESSKPQDRPSEGSSKWDRKALENLSMAISSVGSGFGSTIAGGVNKEAAENNAQCAAKERELANMAQTTQQIATESAQAFNQLQGSSADCASKTVDAAAQIMQLGAGIARELKG